uniref:Uncharacterized protein n=1 Tax=Oryza brachyantha TaxID=4533 RepID=J3NEJ9_ORYBR
MEHKREGSREREGGGESNVRGSSPAGRPEPRHLGRGCCCCAPACQRVPSMWAQAAAASGCLLLRCPATLGAGLVNVAAAGEEEEERRGAAPVVLVHDIFGLGKAFFRRFVSLVQRLVGLSYFAGAEKKDDCVLVPDLGSLTCIHDR